MLSRVALIALASAPLASSLALGASMPLPLRLTAPLRAPLLMMARRRAAKEVEPYLSDAELEEQATAEAQLDLGERVDGMTTSLGKADELLPFPGPAVPADEAPPTDSRLLMMVLSLFPPGRAPSSKLQAAYSSWLKASSARLCAAQYLLSAEQFLEDWENGRAMSEEEIAAIDLAAAAKAEERAGRGR